MNSSNEIALNPDRTKQLLDALLKGKQLSKIHHKDKDCEETLGFDHSFYIGGWASALGQTEDRMLELITNPERWQIKE